MDIPEIYASILLVQTAAVAMVPAFKELASAMLIGKEAVTALARHRLESVKTVARQLIAPRETVSVSTATLVPFANIPLARTAAVDMVLVCKVSANAIQDGSDRRIALARLQLARV